MRGHEQGLVTLDIHEYVEEGSNATFTETQRNELEVRFKGCLMSKKSKRLVVIYGDAINPVAF